MKARQLKTNEPCPVCDGVWFNRFTGECRACKARKSNGTDKRLGKERLPGIKREKEINTMKGVSYAG